MPRWNADGTRRLTTLFDCAAFGYSLMAKCARPGCGHFVIIEGHALWWRFQRKGWDERLWMAAKRLRCEKCGHRGGTLDPVMREPTVHRWPMPPEGEWKRALQRYRC